jgi:hypothetical protein
VLNFLTRLVGFVICVSNSSASFSGGNVVFSLHAFRGLHTSRQGKLGSRWCDAVVEAAEESGAGTGAGGTARGASTFGASAACAGAGTGAGTGVGDGAGGSATATAVVVVVPRMGEPH